MEMEKKIGTGSHHHQSFWLWIMCLTGVDYFSTLGYQPSIAYEATGILTPFATVVLVLVTLFGALPVYAYVAGKSPNGQGSIAMLERLMHGWWGKILVLTLLGFAATDFVITKTLSAADAAEHLVKNPFFPLALQTSYTQLLLTIFLLVLLGTMFLRGFREVIGLAVVIVGIYLTLNAIIIGYSLDYLLHHPTLLDSWLLDVKSGHWHFEKPFETGTDWASIALVCAILFPKLALGLSGFETGVAVMPLIRGDPGDPDQEPHGRIRNTRKLLVTAALIMSFFLLGSSVVISTLISPMALQPAPHVVAGAAPLEENREKLAGLANNRALAYLAHGEVLINGEKGSNISPLFGEAFGTIYDIATVIILWFAGASAMAGLLNLVPRYLPRYGMAPEWAGAIRPLVMMFTAINLFVTWRFNASVEAQGAAYATGVLVLISSACFATLIDKWRHRQGPWIFRISWPYLLITLLFLYTTLANIYEKPVGLQIAGWFILAIIVSSLVSRFYRSTELRFQGILYVDEQSRFLWESMKHLEFPVLVPHRPGTRSLLEKEESIRKEHRLGPEVPIVFLEAVLGDASDFYQTPLLEVKQEEGRFILKVTRCSSIGHVIAALALELSKVGQPPEIHFGWSTESPMAANLNFLLFGEGNVPWLVRDLIIHAERNPERQPRVIIG